MKTTTELIETARGLGAEISKSFNYEYGGLMVLLSPEQLAAVAAPGRCKTCRHWIPVARGREGGICDSDMLTEDYGMPYGPAMLVYPYNEGGEFWTGPEFGCVHHAVAT